MTPTRHATFVDTSGFYAVHDSFDPHHDAASGVWRSLIQSGSPLLTTSFVVSETVALLQNRLGLSVARRFVDDALPIVEVIWIDEPLFRSAVQSWTTAARRTLSLVDCTSFAVMRARGLRAAFAFDSHFLEQGFPAPPTVLPSG